MALDEGRSFSAWEKLGVMISGMEMAGEPVRPQRLKSSLVPCWDARRTSLKWSLTSSPASQSAVAARRVRFCADIRAAHMERFKIDRRLCDPPHPRAFQGRASIRGKERKEKNVSDR